MPIYEYQCNDCNSQFEILTTSSTSTEEVTCDKCKSKNVKKILSAGIIGRNSGPSLSSHSQSGCGAATKSGFS